MTDFVWKPKCVYCSPSSGDLLVGMRNNDANTGKRKLYNNTGRQTQTIPHNSIPHNLYRFPIIITENNNGDVVVADSNRAVVVTSREEFTVSPTSGPSLRPHIVCADTLSHILVFDDATHTLPMLDKDGQFLKYLLKKQSPGIHLPSGLSHDVHFTYTHYRFMRDCKLSLYKYIATTFLPSVCTIQCRLIKIR